MYVYRLEDKDGLGPWYSEVNQNVVDYDALHKAPFAGRTPVMDFSEADLEKILVTERWENLSVTTINPDWKFGCETVDQLEGWFPEMSRWIEDGHFKVVKYSVTEYLVGGHQVAFKCR